MLTTAQVKEAAERVRRGAILLDMVQPGWPLGIHISELNLGGCTGCILGQLYGEYHRATGQLEMPRNARVDFGFQASSEEVRRDDMVEYYGVLQSGWLRQITQRRKPQ